MIRNLRLYNANDGSPFSDRDDAYPAGCFAIGDGGFGLSRWLMVPFVNRSVLLEVGTRRQALKLFNFKLSQLRVVVEQAFGRWKGRWRILRRIPTSPDIAGEIVEACACLHNFLENVGGHDVLPHWIEDIDAEERAEEELRCLRAQSEEALAEAVQEHNAAERRASEALRIAAMSTLEAKDARGERLGTLISSLSGGEVSLAENVVGVIADMPTPTS